MISTFFILDKRYCVTLASCYHMCAVVCLSVTLVHPTNRGGGVAGASALGYGGPKGAGAEGPLKKIKLM